MNDHERELARATIAAEAEALRVTLCGTVSAIEDVHGFRRGGEAFTLRSGQRLAADDPIVVKYPERFRPLTDTEIRLAVASWVRQREWTLGL